MSELKKLHIDWHELEMAFEDIPGEFGFEGEHENYFDPETGRVTFLNDELRAALNAIEKELADALPDQATVQADTVRSTDAFRTLPDWEQEQVLAAVDVRFGDGSRFETIPHIESDESYRYMEDFIATVRDPALRDRLNAAIGQRRPFRRFREVLAAERRLEHEWQAYEHRRQRETIIEWLRSIGVEPANPDDRTFDPPPLPDLRRIMFAEVRRFVRFARDVPGVVRIAVIGSLTTDKEFPNDIDLLVTVTDDCDLAPLAKLGRELSGHMQSHQAGADVFLADPDGLYLGRICLWKKCGGGPRTRCEALHCGVRPYLNDDWNRIRLNKPLIVSPPVTLWPQPTAADSIPADVREGLIDQLARDQP